MKENNQDFSLFNDLAVSYLKNLVLLYCFTNYDCCRASLVGSQMISWANCWFGSNAKQNNCDHISWDGCQILSHNSSHIKLKNRSFHRFRLPLEVTQILLFPDKIQTFKENSLPWATKSRKRNQFFLTSAVLRFFHSQFCVFYNQGISDCENKELLSPVCTYINPNCILNLLSDRSHLTFSVPHPKWGGEGSTKLLLTYNDKHCWKWI